MDNNKSLKSVLVLKLNNNYQRFIEIYSVETNNKLSVRKLAEICEISKSQVQRYISGLNG